MKYLPLFVGIALLTGCSAAQNSSFEALEQRVEKLEETVNALETNEAVRIYEKQMREVILEDGDCKGATQMWNNAHKKDLLRLKQEGGGQIVDFYARSIIKNLNQLADCSNLTW